MIASKHFQKRMQQRAIPSYVVELLLRYGSREQATSHASIVYFDKKGRGKLAEEMNSGTYKKVEKKLAVYLIIRDDLLVTAGYRHKRIKRNLSTGRY